MRINQDWDKSYLKDYLRLDSWQPYNAWRILAGFNYHGPEEECAPDLSLDGSVGYNGSVCVGYKPTDDDFLYLEKMKCDEAHLRYFWENGRIGDNKAYSPGFFINWAISKDHRPDWLDWALSESHRPDWKEWAKEQKIDLAKQTAAKVETKTATTLGETAAYDEKLAALFDLVPVEALEKMFPADNKWKSWADKAASNGLIDARTVRAKFNPYKAGKWFVSRGAVGWDDARLNRTLANNLPARSRDDAQLLVGYAD